MYDTRIKGRGHTRGLWNACRKAFAAVIGVLIILPAFAQEYPNALAVDSVDPHGDSLMIKKMRAKLDSVHRVAQRPTVALVFSGGGAKGAAEVGVLRYLEEQGIPVDLILGTSIGGLVGALYSIGYDSKDIEKLFLNQDWLTVLTDAVDQKYYSYEQKIFKDRYLIQVPFHYASGGIAKIYDDTSYSAADGLLHFGASEDDGKAMLKRFTSSLPSGYAYGFNVNNLISSLTVGYQDKMSFADLPIPFFCVATDVVSCKAKNWGEGYLKTAMRSTMSIPGLFDPVRTKGMILVDGGTRNNFPTDLAKAMGADFIIGVDLSDLDPGYSQVNNIGDVLSQFITMLGKDAFDKNIVTPDVFIKPSISEYNMLSFNPDAIKTMLQRGYAAAQAESASFEDLKAYLGEQHSVRTGSPAINIADTPVMLDAIVFDGLPDDASSVLMDYIDLDITKMVDKKRLDEVMCKLQATRLFDAVTYSLYGKSEPFRLVFHCTPAPVHRMGLSLRMDTEDWASILFNIGLNTHKLMGSRLDLDGRVGQSQNFKLRYSYVTKSFPVLNIELDGGHSRGRISGIYDNVTEMLSYLYHNESVYVSTHNWSSSDIRLGMRNRGYLLPQDSHFGNQIEKIDPSILKADYIGPFMQINLFTMDDMYYPSKGTDVRLEAGYDIWKPGKSNFVPILTASANARFVLPFGKSFAIIPEIQMRSILDGNIYAVNSIFHRNMLGGHIQGRFMDQQIQFMSINNVHIIDYDHLVVTTLDFRSKLYKDLYLSFVAQGMRASNNFLGLVKPYGGQLNFGAALELGYNSILGPIRANVHWSDINKRVGAYLSVGYDF